MNRWAKTHEPERCGECDSRKCYHFACRPLPTSEPDPVTTLDAIEIMRDGNGYLAYEFRDDYPETDAGDGPTPQAAFDDLVRQRPEFAGREWAVTNE